VVFTPQTKYFAHFHTRAPLDLPIEIEKLSAKLTRRRFADRRLPDTG
jgi:hypothetical protein